jgi:hypothetical protein
MEHAVERTIVTYVFQLENASFPEEAFSETSTATTPSVKLLLAFILSANQHKQHNGQELKSKLSANNFITLIVHQHTLHM